MGKLGNCKRALQVMAAVLCTLALSTGAHADHDKNTWVATWATATKAPTAVFEAPPALADVTLRQVVRATVGGKAVRVWLSNEHGNLPLNVAAARVALREAGSAIITDSDRQLTFGGEPHIVVAPGSRVLSDPVRLRVHDLQELAISIYLPDADNGAPISYHPRALQTNYIAPGDQSADIDLLAATTVPSWFFLSAVDVLTRDVPVIVAAGDSITDGDQVATMEPVDQNDRYTDFLAESILQGRGRGHTRAAVINLGISGNQVSDSLIGDSLEARLNRDVLTQTGATHLIIQGGINDIGLPVLLNVAGLAGLFGPDPRPLISAERIIAAYQQLAVRARAAGLVVIAATLSPAGGSALPGYSIDIPVPGGGAEANAKREAVNAWIRSTDVFDAVVDFDLILRDPDDPARLREDLQADGLHPNSAGYAAMAAAVRDVLFGKHGKKHDKGRKDDDDD